MMAETSRPIRPFVVPGSLAELDGPTVSGRVRLPLHLDWSSGREYDLDDPADRARVYEIVLREGTLDDLRTYIDPMRLPDALQRMFLPTAIAEAWRALLDAEPSVLGR
jgi:hypothetical protein